MSTNQKFRNGRWLSLVASHPTTPKSGQPLRVGPLVGVAETDKRADATTSVDFGGVYVLPVKAVDDDGNSAVAIGDPLYYVDADINDGTGFLSKKKAGYFAGHALQIVTSGSTTTVQVRLGQGSSPGALNVGASALSALKVTTVAGGAAGAHTLAGIKTVDSLISVLYFPISADTGTSATGNKVTNVTDLTSEFTISAPNTIDNTAGTATTGGVLVVLWAD